MPQETLNVVSLKHNHDGERWLFLYDETPDVVRAICEEVLDFDSNLTFADGDTLIAAVERLEEINKDLFGENYED